MDINEDSVVELVQSIFSNMLQLSCTRGKDPIASFEGLDGLIASIQINGDWSGAVQIHMSVQFGRKATAAMLMMPEDDVTLSDIQDAVSELANMVGGGVNALLPAGSRLALPVVANGANLGFKLANVIHTQLIPFECEGHEFSIAIQNCNATD